MKSSFNFKLSNKLKEDTKIFCAKTGDSMTDIINLALTQFLERERKHNG